jgi:hypothetical protein
MSQSSSGRLVDCRKEFSKALWAVWIFWRFGGLSTTFELTLHADRNLRVIVPVFLFLLELLQYAARNIEAQCHSQCQEAAKGSPHKRLHTGMKNKFKLEQN